MRNSGQPNILQVFIDEPGGGPANVALLREAIGSDVGWHELALEPALVRGESSSRRQVREAIREATSGSDAELVHSHGVRAASAVAAARLGARLAVTVHGIHAFRRSRGLARAMASYVSRRTLMQMDVVLCTGRSDVALVRQWRVDRTADVRWIHSAFTPPRERDREEARASFGLPSLGKVILWMGRLESQKHPELLIEAVTRMRGRSDLVVVMAGDGPLKDRCTDLIRRRNVAALLSMPGWVGDPSWAYAASDVYVSTARWEGFPLTGLEAAAAGLPLVLTDTPGNRDLVEVGLDATLVPEEPGAVAAGLDGALEAPRPEAGSRTNVLRSFSVEVLRDEVLAAYQDVLRSW